MRIPANVLNIGIIMLFIAGISSVVYAVKVINEPVPDLRGDSYELELPSGHVIDVPRNRQ
jgi:hypothetical protein